MPKDLFQEAKKYQPKDLFADQGMAPGEDGILRQGLKAAAAFALPEEAQQRFGLEDVLSRGLASGMASLPINLANLIPGVNVPQISSPDNIYGKISKGIGEVMGFGGAGIGAKGITKLAETLPARVAGATAYGAIESPEDRMSGALYGLTLGAASEAIPLVAKGVSEASKIVRPAQSVKELKTILNKKTVKDIENESKDLYSPVNEQVKNTPIYKNLEFNYPYAEGKGIKGMDYLGLSPEKLKDLYSGDTKILHKQFIENPTFSNAHLLQQDIGERIGELIQMKSRMGGLGAAERNELSGLRHARDMLKNDIYTFLDRFDPNLSSLYERATKHFRESVVPMRNAHDILKNLPENSKPERIVSSFEKAVNKGKIIPEHILENIDQMKRRIAARNIAQPLVALLSAGKLSSGAPMGGKLLNEAAAAALASPILNSLGRKLGAVSSGDLMSRISENVYPVAKRAFLATKLGGNQ